jgi:GH25 family lysozyme M1 (1,4-beta-N-acetylmuramidase)
MASRQNWPVMFRAGAMPGELPPPPGPLAAAHPAVILPDVVKMADISEFQMDVNDAMYLAWSKAIIIRAAYGARHDDRAWRGGRRRDLLHSGGVKFLGIYQYVVAGQDAAAQAREFCRLIGTLRQGEIPIADIEEGAGDLRQVWRTWNRVVTDTLGFAPLLYSGRFFARDHGLAPVDWIASYGTAEPPEPHMLWQFADNFQVPGVGRCDCSVFHGSIDELAALAYQPAADRPATTTEDDMPSGLITSPHGVRETHGWRAGTARQIVLHSDWEGVQDTPPVVDLRVAHLNSAPFAAGHKTVDGTVSYDIGTPADCNGCSFTRVDSGAATVGFHTN